MQYPATNLWGDGMTIKYASVFLLAFVGLWGCAQPGGQRPSLSPVQAAAAQATAYCQNLYAQEGLTPLKGLMPDYGQQPSFEMRANRTRPTPAQLPAVKLRAEAFMECTNQFRARVYMPFKTPQHVAVYDAYANAGVGLLARLYNSEISFGEVLETSQKLRSEIQVVMSNIDDAIAARNLQAAMQVQQNYQMTIQNAFPRTYSCVQSGRSWTHCF